MKTKLMAVLALVGLITALLVGCVGKAPERGLDVVKAVFDTLSAPEMRGRRVGTEENVAAGEYLAQIMEEIGLEPVFGADFACPYRQGVFDTTAAGSRLMAHLADGSQRELKLGSEFIFSLRNAPVDSTLSVTFDLDDPDLTEKIYVNRDLVSSEQPSGAIFDVYPGEAGHVSAQPFEVIPRRDLWIEQTVLQELLDDGLSAFTVSCQDTRVLALQCNYIGVIKGQDSSRAVVIGAHFDGAGADGDTYAAGAIDNASGVAVMLGMAQLLNTGEKPPLDVVICAFNGEESSHRYGAEAVAADLIALYEGCYYINVDCVGLVEDKPYQYRASGRLSLEEDFASALQAAGYTLTEYGIGGDWSAFVDVGTPAVALAQETLGVRHTIADRPEAIDVPALEKLAKFLADFIRNNGNNVYAPEHSDPFALQKKLASQGRELAERLQLGVYDNYMFQQDGHYVCISGNRPVSSVQELKAMFPWVDVRENLGPYRLQEVLAVEYLANKPFEVTNEKISRNLAPSGAQTVMPLDTVASAVPGPLDSYFFVYEDSEGKCIRLSVSRVNSEKDWESLSRYCDPLVSPDGKEIANVYASYLDTAEVMFLNFYTGRDFFVQIAEYDTSRPTSDVNGYGNSTFAWKPLSLQDAVELVEQLGLNNLDDYFATMLRQP